MTCCESALRTLWLTLFWRSDLWLSHSPKAFLNPVQSVSQLERKNSTGLQPNDYRRCVILLPTYSSRLEETLPHPPVTSRRSSLLLVLRPMTSGWTS